MAKSQRSLTVLLTDGVGQIGRAIIDSIASVSPSARTDEKLSRRTRDAEFVLPAKIKVLAGHHSTDDAHLVASSDHNRATVQTPSSIPMALEAVLVDWKDDRSWVEACCKLFQCGMDANSDEKLPDLAVVLLLPFTIEKKDLVERWVAAISEARELVKHSNDSNLGSGSPVEERPEVHVVLAGIHSRYQHAYSKSNADWPDQLSNPTLPLDDTNFLLHEEASFEAEQTLRRLVTSKCPFIHPTFVRINFDGFNTLCQRQTTSHPLPCIAWFLPKDIPYGWIARSDIADFIYQLVLDGPMEHTGKVYPLSTTLISLTAMADIVSTILALHESSKISAVQMSGKELAAMALDPKAVHQSVSGYEDCIKSLANMFTILAEESEGGDRRADRGEAQTETGVFKWHNEIFPDGFRSVVGRDPLDFPHWLLLNEQEVRRRLGLASGL